MRTATFCIALTLLYFSLNATAFAQSGTDQCFVLDGTSDFYFGEIDQHDTVEHTFVFKNNCTQTVEIEQARASCGCTAAVLSDKVIPPGGEAKIAVKFTPPRGTRGRTTKTLSVHLKDEQRPHTVIRISATVKTDLDVQPTYIQLTGAEVGKEIKGSVTVTNVSGKNLMVSGITTSLLTYTNVPGESNSQAIPLAVGSVEPSNFELKPDESREITVRLTPTHAGQINGMIRIMANGNEGMIQVFGVVREPMVDMQGSGGHILDPDKHKHH